MTALNYIEDSLNQLIDQALELRENGDNEFDKGRLYGYYEIISKLLNQAEAFDISKMLSLKVREFNPESLLDKL
ncbi:hypothetical protein [Lunatibacter salilacus]|uniref:hypothetical protein n=1 Tax=Lunatibacter salilacus TaxID=2483804 RepID=UPI00131A822F|nr:hypothetical protein [Lunatibacter salilacus]